MNEEELKELEKSCTKGWYSDKDIRPLVDNCKSLIAEVRTLHSKLNKAEGNYHGVQEYNVALEQDIKEVKKEACDFSKKEINCEPACTKEECYFYIIPEKEEGK